VRSRTSQHYAGDIFGDPGETCFLGCSCPLVRFVFGVFSAVKLVFWGGCCITCDICVTPAEYSTWCIAPVLFVCFGLQACKPTGSVCLDAPVASLLRASAYPASCVCLVICWGPSQQAFSSGTIESFVLACSYLRRLFSRSLGYNSLSIQTLSIK